MILLWHGGDSEEVGHGHVTYARTLFSIEISL